MDNFERAFEDISRDAASTLKAAADLTKQAKQLQKAARDGNIAAVKKGQVRLNDMLGHLAQAVSNAVKSWPFEDDEEEQYLRDGYATELRRVASKKGLDIHERDGQLISHPSIVRILPVDRAVRIDKRKVSNIRPSHLADILLQSQKTPGRYRAQPFLEALYRMYLALTKDSSGRLIDGASDPVIPLASIYRLFTSLPSSNREYAPTDFARDVYLLDKSGLTKTRSGATASFPASTGARSAKDLFSFVGPDGREVKYYGIRFIA